jgi:anti-anti-sigma factor
VLSPEPSPEAPLDQDPAPFDCVVHRSDRSAAWIRLVGALDADAAPRLANCLHDALCSARLVVVDIRGLSSIDGAGLDAIAAAHDRARRSERRLLLVRGRQSAGRLQEVPGPWDRFEVADLPLVLA